MKFLKTIAAVSSLLLSSPAHVDVGGVGDVHRDEHGHGHEPNEVMTTIILSFASQAIAGAGFWLLSLLITDGVLKERPFKTA